MADWLTDPATSPAEKVAHFESLGPIATTVHEFTEDDFGILTEADVAMIEFAAQPGLEPVDYSEFYLDDEDD